MRGEQLVIFATNDLSGITRGRALPRVDTPGHMRTGVSWVPANLGISAFGPIAPNPWGPMGDLRLIPDPDTEVRVDLWEDASPLHFYLCDIVHTDGAAFDACPRAFLKHALADLRDQTGLTIRTAFEHEFHLAHIEDGPGGAFGFDRYRLTEPFAPLVMEALRLAGQEPEVFMTEYAPHQFEVTVRPTVGLAGADRAVVVREVVREVARRLGNRASFSPVIDPAGTGNGVHIHFSLFDSRGLRTYDPDRPGRVSDVAGQFIAGVLRHLPGMVALTCPSDISYLRLKPDRWSAAFTAFDANNREAAVRICPTVEFEGMAPAPQFHFEFRGVDGAASPYIALGAMVRAGLEGIRAGLDTPPLIGGHPGELSAEARARLGVKRLPTSLEEALQEMERDAVVCGWLSRDMLSCYTQLKRFEMGMLEGLDDVAKCRRYMRAY